MATNMKYVPVTDVLALESWGVELGGLISALSVTVNAVYDRTEGESEEANALFGLLCALRNKKDEFDGLVSNSCNRSITAALREVKVG